VPEFEIQQTVKYEYNKATDKPKNLTTAALQPARIAATPTADARQNAQRVNSHAGRHFERITYNHALSTKELQ
jgi:hypothetical protein